MVRKPCCLQVRSMLFQANTRNREEGQKISKMERDDGFNKIEIYVRWMRDRVLTGDRANAFVVLPLENMSPRYRDEIPKWVLGLINDAWFPMLMLDVSFKRPPQGGINALALAPVLKAPVLAVPSKWQLLKLSTWVQVTEMYNSQRNPLRIEDHWNYRNFAFRSCNHVPSRYVFALVVKRISRLRDSRGTDLMLMETIHDILKSTGRPTVVKTGKTMF
jgi:hypothetical protein